MGVRELGGIAACALLHWLGRRITAPYYPAHTKSMGPAWMPWKRRTQGREGWAIARAALCAGRFIKIEHPPTSEVEKHFVFTTTVK